MIENEAHGSNITNIAVAALFNLWKVWSHDHRVRSLHAPTTVGRLPDTRIHQSCVLTCGSDWQSDSALFGSKIERVY